MNGMELYILTKFILWPTLFLFYLFIEATKRHNCIGLFIIRLFLYNNYKYIDH